MKKKLLAAFSVNGCVELNDIKSNISIDKGIASSSTTADYKSFFNRHKEGESNILNKNGNWQWAKGAGGTDYDVGVATTMLSDDSTIVIGSFSGSATFGKGESCETVLVSDGSTDIFVAHYNTDGTIMWAKRAGGTDYDVGQGIVTLSDDSTIVIGSFEGIADFGPYDLTSQGDSDVFVAKLGNQPPSTPTIDGPTEGTAGEQYTYEVCSTDPEGDDIIYCFDFGDDSDEICIGPFTSGTCQTIDYTWAEEGTYVVKVKATDVYGDASDWATLEVVMPVNQQLEMHPLFQRILERFPNAFPILRHLCGL
jgi:endogenous inhibitor of DNA gyrase (YacG/DUF329 family)